MEGAELTVLMICICCAGTFAYGQKSPLARLHLSQMAKSAVMGTAVAAATYLIIHSPLGRRSGAHFNPALTTAYLFLRRIHRWDVLGYITAQFFGGILGVFLAQLFLGMALSDDPVRFAATTVGRHGELIAFAGEFFFAFALMAVVLFASNHRKLAPFSPIFVALMTVFFYLFSQSVAGYSANPARSLSSALFAMIWRGIWIFLLAPTLGMVVAALVYQRVMGEERIYCAKVFHDLTTPCPFNCRFHELMRSGS
jgi:aquaporin Z